MAAAPTFSPAMSTADNYNRWIMSAFSGYLGRRIVEIGIGHGEFRRLLPDRCDYVGVDIDQALIDNARRRSPGSRYVLCDASSPAIVQHLGAGGFDTVLCLNVLEHIGDDRQALGNMLRLLCPGGHLLLFVPAMPFLYGDLDRLAGHHRRYTRTTLAALAKGQTATVEKLEYFNAIGGVGWLCNRFTTHRSLDGARVEWQIRLFDRGIYPVARVLDPLTRRVFGQSIVAVIRRD